MVVCDTTASKNCRGCGNDKPITDFPNQWSRGVKYVRAICKACFNDYRRSRPAAAVARTNELNRQWRTKNAVSFALTSAKQRAKKFGWACDIDLPFLKELVAAQQGRCAVTGMTFNMEADADKYRVGPYKPSIDRIDARVGYVRGNVRLVLACVNFALNEFGDEVFQKVAAAAVAQHWLTISDDDAPA